jgi:hypothetical protein
VARLLFIVSRTLPARYEYFKYVFASETVDVIFDRRMGERRRRREPAAVERRRAERRRQDVTRSLETLGWTLVRR